MNSASGNMNLLTLDPGCNTPRTPEILNTVLNMTNPWEGFVHGGDVKPPMKTSSLATTSLPHSKASASATTSSTTTTTSSTAYIGYSDSSNSSSCASQQDLIGVAGTSATADSVEMVQNSVQRNRTELIKASLKLTIEQKRKQQCDQDDSLLDLDQYRKRVKKSECSESEEDKMLSTVGLTPEDEERRKRRRERNKIAATKCRLKKRERTANLITESDTLEHQNVDFKTQIDQLNKEKLKLEQVLDSHRRQCVMNIPPVTREKLVATGVNRRLSGMDSVGSPLSNRSSNRQHQHSYSNNSSPSSVTPVSTLSPSSTNNNRPASVDLTCTNTYLHSTLELYPSPITGGDCQLQQMRSSSVGAFFLHNGRQMHHQQMQQQLQYSNNRAPSITIVDDCGNEAEYTPHLTDMDQPNGSYDYDYHDVYGADAATNQNMFSLMT